MPSKGECVSRMKRKLSSLAIEFKTKTKTKPRKDRRRLILEMNNRFNGQLLSSGVC